MIGLDTSLLAYAHRGDAGFAERLTAQAVALRLCGDAMFDLQIGLICLEAGATEIWTHDRSFVTLPGLRVFDPLTSGSSNR